MEIMLISIEKNPPEGFQKINSMQELSSSSALVLHSDNVDKALSYLASLPDTSRGLIVTQGRHFESFPASSTFWHLTVPKSSFTDIKDIAGCFLDVFGCENIPKADSYDALQNRISALLMETVRSRHNQDMLRKSEAEFKQVNELANIGSWRWNLKEEKVTLSPELCRIYAISENKEYSNVNDLLNGFTHPDDLEDVRKVVLNTSTGFEPKPLTFRIIRPNGDIRWVTSPKPEIVKMDNAGIPIEIVGIQQDITDQKKAEEDLHESELKLGEAARNIPGIIFQFYIRQTGEYGIDFVTGNLEKVFGIPEDTENLFESFVQGIPSRKLKDEFYSTIDSAVTEIEDWNFEIPFQKPSGEIIYVSGLSKPTLLKDVLLFNGVMLNVTDKRNARQRIENLNSLLLAIRNVNQLIVQDIDIDDLLQKACETLFETRSYRDCTVILIEDEDRIGAIYQAGKNSYQKDEHISDRLPDFLTKRLVTSDPFVIMDESECEGCWFIGKYDDVFHPTFVAPMKSESRAMGFLIVAHSSDSEIDSEEMTLLEEVTDDLAYAIRKLDADRELVRSEKRYRKLFDSSHDAIMTLEPPSWKFTSGNPSILEMFEVKSIEEFTSMGPWELSPEYQPDGSLSSEKAMEMIELAMEEGSNYFDWTHSTVSGRQFPATVLLTRVSMQDSTFLQATVQDITERLEMEKALKASEARIRGLADSVPGAIYQFYATPDGESGFYFVSERATEILGISSNPEGFFDRFVDRIPIENRRPFVNSSDEAVRNLSEWEYTTPFIKPSGDLIWIKGMSIPTEFENETVFNGVLLDVTDQIKAENELRAERDFTSSIIKGTPAVIVGISPEGITKYINPSGEKVTGYSSDEIVGRNWWKVFYPGEEYRQVERLFRMFSEEGNVTDFEMTLVSRNGDRRIISWNSINRLDDMGSIIEIIGFGFDVTERKKAEEGLQESEQLFRSLVENAPAGIFLVDGNYKIIYSNEQLCRISGYSIDEIIGLDFRQVLEKSSRKKVIERYKRRQRGEKVKNHYELGVLRKDGSLRQAIVYVDHITDPRGNVRTLGEIIDITERKKTESELNHLRNYLANIIDSMPSVLIGVSKVGKITLWNSGAADRTGLNAQDAFGRELVEVIPWLEKYTPLISESISSREVKYRAKQNTSTGKDIRFEDLTVYPLVANDVEGVVLRLDDVTEQVHIEEMMIQSEKMLSVGGLAAGMAHEINNPLAGMMQNAEVILKRLTGDLPANDKIAEEEGTTMKAIRGFLEKRSILRQLELIHDSGKRAAGIVQNMLSFARKSEAKRTLHNVAELLDKTLELAQNDYDLKKKFDFRHIEIKKKYKPSLPEILCEKSKIQQVFLNILRNGTEAMWLSKSTTGKPKNPRFTLRVYADNGYIVTEIEDNGPGIPENIRKRIFEPFFTTKEAGFGTGLGLSVSYFIITDDHGGELEVESKPGKNTVFIVRLPLDSEREPDGH